MPKLPLIFKFSILKLLPLTFKNTYYFVSDIAGLIRRRLIQAYPIFIATNTGYLMVKNKNRRLQEMCLGNNLFIQMRNACINAGFLLIYT